MAPKGPSANLDGVLEVLDLVARLETVVVDGLVLVVEAVFSLQQRRLEAHQLLVRVFEAAHRRALAHLQLHDVPVQFAWIGTKQLKLPQTGKRSTISPVFSSVLQL